MDLRERVYVALDAKDVFQALDWAEKISPIFGRYKVGSILIAQSLRSNVPVLGRLHSLNPLDDGNIFFDDKLHDTPSTAYQTVRELSRMPEINMITVHVLGEQKMCNEALRAAQESREKKRRVGENGIYTSKRPKIMGITALSSSEKDQDTVLRRAEQAAKYRLDGIVSHASFIPALEKEFKSDLIYVATALEFNGLSGRYQHNPYPLQKAIEDSEKSLLVLGSALTKSRNIKETAYEIAELA